MLLSDLNNHISDHFKIKYRYNNIKIFLHDFDFKNIIEQYLINSPLDFNDIIEKATSCQTLEYFLPGKYNIYQMFTIINHVNNNYKHRGIRVELEHCRIITSYAQYMYGKVLTENERIIKNIIE